MAEPRWSKELDAIEALAANTTGTSWKLGGEAAGGLPTIEVERPDAVETIIRVTRDREPATRDDVEFIANSRSDFLMLSDAIRGKRTIAPEELDAMAERVHRASPGPWRVFLESDGGSGGSSVIQISDRDDQPDMYLWIGTDLAPDPDFEFIATVRELIPRLIDVLRQESA